MDRTKQQPLVSIIMPAYNAARTILESIESVLAQSYRQWELIVVDDGSTDGTSATVEKVADQRVLLLKQENSGVAAARNRDLEQAQGEYIAFLDSDDIWVPEKLEKQVDVFRNEKKGNTGLVYTEKRCFSEKTADAYACRSRQFDDIADNFLRLLIFNYIATLTVMTKKSVIEDVGMFDESLFGTEDWDLWIRIAKRYEIACIDEELAYYRVHEQGISKNRRRTIEEVYKVMQKHLENGAVPKSVIRKAYWLYYRRKVYLFYTEKRYLKSFLYLLRSILADPFNRDNKQFWLGPLRRIKNTFACGMQ